MRLLLVGLKSLTPSIRSRLIASHNLARRDLTGGADLGARSPAAAFLFSPPSRGRCYFPNQRGTSTCPAICTEARGTALAERMWSA